MKIKKEKKMEIFMIPNNTSKETLDLLAEEILKDLCDRRSFKRWYNSLHEDIQPEIVKDIVESLKKNLQLCQLS